MTVVIRYCQDSINVERKYSYLHLLEDKISAYIGDDDLYRREGRAYLKDFPGFSGWVWAFYVAVFPLLILIVTATLASIELFALDYPKYTQILDVAAAIGIVLSFVLYRVLATLFSVWEWVERVLRKKLDSGKKREGTSKEKQDETLS